MSKQGRGKYPPEQERISTADEGSMQKGAAASTRGSRYGCGLHSHQVFVVAAR
jgi:hypothetical protein